MSEVKTFAVIPTKFKSGNKLYDLIRVLEKDRTIHRIYVLDNSGDEPIIRNSPRVRDLLYPDSTIYEMWNDSWDYIKSSYPGKVNIAFLNDDITLWEGTIGALAELLRADDSLAAISPDSKGTFLPQEQWRIEYTDSTGGAGGLLGYCFMIKGELDIPPIDENLTLYWGDDDLVKQIGLKGYKVAKVVGIPIQHDGGATTRTMDRAKWNAIMEHDRMYFNRKYGENRSPVIL